MNESLIPAARLELLGLLAKRVCLLPGAVAEIGVYRGGSAARLAYILPGRPLHLFDTFEGLPEPGLDDGPTCTAGRFSASVLTVLAKVPDAIIHQGKLDACSHVPQIPYAFVHIDVDLFQSTFDVLTLFYPLVMPGGIIAVDDYGSKHTPGATRAVDTFMRNAPEELVLPRVGGCWFKRQ